MWRNQSYNTSSDSMLDLDTDKMRGQSFCRPMESWRPPYVGRCVGECDISQRQYHYPMSYVRPDYPTMNREMPTQNLPAAPDLPYSHHTPPLWMDSNDPEKYYKSGYTGNRFFTFPQFGHTSKVEAQSALCDFTNGYQFTKSTEWAPLPFYHTSLDGDRPGSEIYPRSTGMISSYKGHVPGMQHSYGKTFGHQSVNAKRYLGDSSICLH